MTKERPILFSGEMVRATLEGRKTQTRRVIKPQPAGWHIPEPCCIETPEGWQGPIDRSLWADQADQCDGEPRRCPHGKPGDSLWVQEAFAYVGSSDPGFLVYRADYPECAKGRGLDSVSATIEECGYRWKNSIHMPRSASRITLEIKGLRVERLQDISEADARAEGAMLVYAGEGHNTHRAGFKNLWQSIYGTDSWDANPWVWVIEFERVKP